LVEKVSSRDFETSIPLMFTFPTVFLEDAMKRDWDVIRKILIALESKTDRAPLRPEDISDVDSNLAAYNMHLLMQSNFIEGSASQSIGMGYQQPPIVGLSLTWRGHELLDSIRQDTTWNHVKTTAKEKGLDLTIDVVAAIVKAYISARIGLPM
jgi:Hypothetical protein (DUF2513)